MSGAQSESPNPPSEPAPGAAIEIDLYCLHCGYNLRGLSGDPVRCPECGYRFAVADLLCPPKAVARRLRRMSRRAWSCVLCTLAFLFLLSVSLASREPGPGVCAFVLGPLLWGIGLTEFKNSCVSEPGWSRALLRFHVGAVLALLVVAAPCAIVGLAVWSIRQPLGEILYKALILTAVISTAVISLRPAARFYRRGRREFEPLARKAEFTYQAVTAGRLRE
jgi:hypothetical protein